VEKHHNTSPLIGLILACIILCSHSASAETQFDVNVPLRTPVIRDIEIFVVLPVTTTGDVTFRVSRTSFGNTISHDFTVNSSVGSPSVSHYYTYDEPVFSSPSPDTVTTSAHLVRGTAVTKRFEVRMELETNWYINEFGVCADRQNNIETWRIETLANGVPTAPPITGACINSYEYVVGSATCDRKTVPTTDNPAVIINNAAISTISPCTDESLAAPKPPTLVR